MKYSQFYSLCGNIFLCTFFLIINDKAPYPAVIGTFIGWLWYSVLMHQAEKKEDLEDELAKKVKKENEHG